MNNLHTPAQTPEHPTFQAGKSLAVETIGMTRVFGSLVALDDVSIKVETGQFRFFPGENGAGRSTLVKCIMGVQQSTKGSMLVNNAPVSIRSPGDARAAHIGMVYQHFTLAPCMTGAN